MATITASSVATTDSLETFRQRFNTLRSDIQGLSFGASIVFEGATADNFETTLAVTDPTADRTVTVQDKSGVLAMQGRDINDIVVLDASDGSGTDEAGAILLNSSASGVDEGEALLYEEGTSDHLLNPVDATPEFILMEDSVEGRPVNLVTEVSSEKFIYQSATGDNLLGGLFIPPAAGGVQYVTPIADGNANQVLSTDGAGNLQFVNQSDGLSLNNDGNNRVITATGSNTGNGEANLTFDGSTLAVTGAVTSAAITASGIIKTDDTTAATSTTDGSLQTDGGLSVTLDAVIGDDLILLSDAAVIHFGADSDVTLTHVADTGILLNGTSVIQFNDASQNIGAPSATVLDINATDEIELNSTLIDVNGNLDVSGTSQLTGTATVGTNSSGNSATLVSNSFVSFKISGDAAQQLGGLQWSNNSGTVVANIWKTGDPATNGTSPLRINSLGTIEFRANEIGIDGDLADVRIVENGDVKFLTDGVSLDFGANSEIALTHNHNVGLLMTSTAYAPLARRGEDVFIVLDQTAAGGTDAGDNVIMNASDGSSTDDGDDIIGEDEVFLHSGMQRNVIEIRSSSGKLLNSLAGFAPGAI